MYPQNPQGQESGGYLALQWQLFGDYEGVCIQVSETVDRKVGLRTFVLPPSTGCHLDVGSGSFWFRIGTMFKQSQDVGGTVLWSGTYGPIMIGGSKEKVPIKPSPVKFKKVQPILDGLRIETGLHRPYWVFVEFENHEKTVEKTLYIYDNGKGYFDIGPFNPTHTYDVVLSTFSEEIESLAMTTVKELAEPRLLKGQQTARTGRFKLNSDIVTLQSGKLLLKEAAANPNKRYSSYADYLNVISLEAQNSEKPRRL